MIHLSEAIEQAAIEVMSLNARIEDLRSKSSSMQDYTLAIAYYWQAKEIARMRLLSLQRERAFSDRYDEVEPPSWFEGSTFETKCKSIFAMIAKMIKKEKNRQNRAQAQTA